MGPSSRRLLVPRTLQARRSPRPGGQGGAVLLAALLFLLILTLGAGTLVESMKTQAQREREEQLLFVGDQYRRAIASYRAIIGPGGARSLPASLDDLLADHRFPTPIHHLRRLYPDPMTGKPDWELVRLGNGIAGVRSRSHAEPIKQAGFEPSYSHFEGKPRYADWVFAVPAVP